MSPPLVRKHSEHLEHLRRSGNGVAAGLYAAANREALVREYREQREADRIAEAEAEEQRIAALAATAPHHHRVEQLRANGQHLSAEFYRRSHTLAIRDEQRRLEGAANPRESKS